MTVAELIEKLKEMPRDAMVVIRGYEGGVDEADSIKECSVLTDFYEESYYGAHEIISDYNFKWHDHKYDVAEESPGLYLFSKKEDYKTLRKMSEETFYCKSVSAVYIWSSMQGYSREKRKTLKLASKAKRSD